MLIYPGGSASRHALAGTACQRVRWIRAHGETLRKAIEEDILAGLVPFFVSKSSTCLSPGSLLTKPVATVGTTSSGAVDRIAEIGEVCESSVSDRRPN